MNKKTIKASMTTMLTIIPTICNVDNSIPSGTNGFGMVVTIGGIVVTRAVVVAGVVVVTAGAVVTGAVVVAGVVVVTIPPPPPPTPAGVVVVAVGVVVVVVPQLPP